jgi:ATP-dependent DNA helicase RecQ
VLKLQEAARAVLRAEQTLQLAVPRLVQTKASSSKTTAPQNYDRKLFARLKVLRKAIAERDDVPPFVVFSDATLIEMAQACPTNSVEFLAISGVGQTKLGRYGADFLDLISDYLAGD